MATAAAPPSSDWVDGWIASYAAQAGAGDVMHASLAQGGGAWRDMLEGIAALTGGDLARAQERVARQAHELGTAFRLPGDAEERSWPLSPLPLVIGEADWRLIEAGVTQRAELQERLLADLYGPQTVIAEGLLPAAVVTGSPHLQRAMINVAPTGGHWLHIYAADLARGPDGEWRVLADHARAPSGAGYALENRLALSRVMGDLLNRLEVQRLASFFTAFREGLSTVCARTEPRIALLTPGRYSQSYAEQAHIARYMGMLLVEGEDLAVHEDRLFVRTIAGLKRVDAVWRRMDARWLDPLAFDSHSSIGVPGIMDAMAAGNTVVANMPGAGIVESPGMAAFLPQLSRRLLHVDLLLPNIATWWCGQPKECAEVIERLDRLLIAPAFGIGVAGLADGAAVLGANLSEAARSELLAGLAARPQDYVGQEVVRLSTMPSVVDGAIAPRPFTLRVFAARALDGRWQVMPGGFARIGDQSDVRAVIMGEGATSADVAVIAGPIDDARSLTPDNIHIRRNPGTLQSRAADNLFWLGRYLERGEAHLRLVRAALGGTIDADGGTAVGSTTTDHLADLLISSGAAARTAKAKGRDLPLLVRTALDDAGEWASVRSLLATARRIGEGTRERLSADVWRLLDAPLEPLPNSDAASMLNRATLLQERFSALAGLAAENMVRTSGWRFHDLGRRLERSAEVCRISRTFAADDATLDDLATLLELSDSQISYRFRYPEGVGLAAVRDLIALDPWNPRSLTYQVKRIAAHLAALPTLRDDGMPEEPMALANALVATVSVAKAEEISVAAMLGIENRLYALSDAIGTRYFLQGSEAVRSTGTMRLA